MSFGSFGSRKKYDAAQVGEMNRHQRRQMAKANQRPMMKGTNKPHVTPKKNTKAVGDERPFGAVHADIPPADTSGEGQSNV